MDAIVVAVSREAGSSSPVDDDLSRIACIIAGWAISETTVAGGCPAKGIKAQSLAVSEPSPCDARPFGGDPVEAQNVVGCFRFSQIGRISKHQHAVLPHAVAILGIVAATQSNRHLA